MDRGFLPEKDPICVLDDSEYSCVIDNLGKNLSSYLLERRVREELVSQLRATQFGKDEIQHWIDHSMGSNAEKIERAMCLFSYFASSYVFATEEKNSDRIPVEIGLPFHILSQRLGRHPILSYASYCLYNWKRIDENKPVELGNIELLQKFVHPSIDGSVDEDWFILVHVEIEEKASKAINVISNFKKNGDKDKINGYLVDLHDSLKSMNAVLRRMPEYCRPDYYFDKVRPYIFSFNNMKYEGVYDDKVTYRGETGAQSSIVPAIQTILGVKHKKSLLTEHLDVMREYMPSEHRSFLTSLESINNFRDYALADSTLKDIYNDCLSELIIFRELHLHYAVEYIHKKVPDPTGTGGTPFMKWLSQLVEETKEYIL